ncbi:hypothetical protein P3T22_006408 [Paraburkholderia sp. GAS348]
MVLPALSTVLYVQGKSGHGDGESDTAGVSLAGLPLSQKAAMRNSSYSWSA